MNTRLVPAAAPAGIGIRFAGWPLAWACVLSGCFALYWVGIQAGESATAEKLSWLVNYPRGWKLGLAAAISSFMKYLIGSLDLGLFTFKELTRGIAWLIEQPYTLVKSLLSSGFLKGVGSYAEVVFPRLSWLAVIAAVALAGLHARDWKLALLVTACFAYLAIFGQWDSAMVTLSSIAIAVPFAVAGGLVVGVIGFRSRPFAAILTPTLDLMQTVPVFAYLVPILILFGFGPVSAMIATIIYAMPPMVRTTQLALRQVPGELTEAGAMSGCSRRQLLWKVQLPSAKNTLMVGVNQVVMLSLNMVIIASMIGAGGLGHDVLTALKRLRIGEGLEAGIAITLLAIALDRLSQAFAHRSQDLQHAQSGSFAQRHRLALSFTAIAVFTWLAGLLLPALHDFPQHWQVTTGSFWADVVRYINVNFYDPLNAVKNFLLLNIMVPLKRFLLDLPWAGVAAIVALAGYQLGGARLALVTASLAVFIAVTGLWDKAMVTVYLCGLSVLIACLIGIPIGIAGARNDRLHGIVSAVIDTLQTLPSFVYLIPVVMLFRVGDFAAMVAVIAYAVTPAVRYTSAGLRAVPAEIIEAATQAGCTQRQLLFKVQLPLAMPHIMLGVNQTIMMALSMLVITALVGTRELGQEVYIALTKADTGRGIVAGVCVAAIAIISDRLIGAWARRRKSQLGID